MTAEQLKTPDAITADMINEKAQKEYIKFIGDLKDKTKEKDTKEVTDAFIDHGDDVLKGIKDNMITNFSTIDATSTTAPYLSTYVDAKIAFDEDIKSLITLNTPAPKTEKEKNTPKENFDDVYYSADNTTEKTSKELEKLKGLSEITTEIGYLIQLKNLEAGKEPGTDFNADKLKTFVKDNNLEKNMAQKTDTKRDRFQIISEKNILVEAAAKTKTTEETNAANAKEATNKTRTKETAKDFFETKANEDTFNAVFKDIATITTTNIETYKTTETDKTDENKVKNFVNLLQKYTKDDKISSISLKVAGDNDAYKKGTNMITYKCKNSAGDLESRIITFGTQDKMQQTKADKFDITDIKINLSIENPLAQFDGKGNYRSLEKYIVANPTIFEDNFKHITDAILAYTNKDTTTTDKSEKLDDLKNGYANILTDYIVANPKLIEEYNSALISENKNISLLGVDTATRTANYNKLVSVWATQGDKMDKTTMAKIVEIGNTIGASTKMTPNEIISKGLDSLINSFGPMLFSMLKFLGIGKRSLLKMFPGAEDKINKMFTKEYGLSEDAIKAAKTISKEYAIDPLKDVDTIPTAKQLKKSFGEEKDISTYVAKLTSTTNNYYKYIDTKVIKQGIALYNKDKANADNQISSIDDILTTEIKEGTETTNKKTSITGIIAGKETIFEGVLKSIVSSDTTRAKIYTANKEIQTDVKKDNVSTGQNEQGLTIGTANLGYAINNQQDIVRYLTASLFSDQDLGYVITENELSNGKVVEKAKDVVATEYTVNKATKMKNATDVTTTTDVAIDTKVKSVIEDKIEVKDKTGLELKLTDVTEQKATFREVDINGVKGWIDVTYLTAVTPVAKTEVKEDNKTVKELKIKTDYAAAATDGVYTLKAITDSIKIQDIFDNTSTNRPTKLEITPTGEKTTITVEKGTIDKVDTYVYPTGHVKAGKRAEINTGDKIKAVAEAVVETADQKFTKNRGLISGETGVKKITENKYGALDTSTFTYKADATDVDTVAYQTNVLTPFETILTNKDQYPLFITSLLSSTNYTGLGLFEKPTHLKNTLSMIDTKNKTSIYTEVIKELETADNTYTVEVKKDSKSIIITSSDKKKITLSQKTENAVTTLDAKITTA